MYVINTSLNNTSLNNTSLNNTSLNNTSLNNTLGQGSGSGYNSYYNTHSHRKPTGDFILGSEVDVINKSKNIMCINCEKYGHTQKKCAYPINSYGIIIFKKHYLTIKYLLIQRKFSHAFTDILWAKYYDINGINLTLLCNYVKCLPWNERIYILKYDFNVLWNKSFMINTYNDDLKYKFNYVKHEFLEYLFTVIDTQYNEPFWEFPKGKKFTGETNIECAVRECMEETTLKTSDYYIYPNLNEFKDVFIGSNGKKYCNNYFIGELSNNHKTIYYKYDNYQQNSEIRKIGWFTYDQFIKLIDNNHIDMIKYVHNLLTCWKLKPAF
jgi:8-oxo-dGTP pyrophosphatase MutT (NUDIX family)